MTAEDIIEAASGLVWGETPSIAGLTEVGYFNNRLLAPLVAGGLRTGDEAITVTSENNPIRDYLNLAGMCAVTLFVSLSMQMAVEAGVSAEDFDVWAGGGDEPRGRLV